MRPFGRHRQGGMALGRGGLIAVAADGDPLMARSHGQHSSAAEIGEPEPAFENHRGTIAGIFRAATSLIILTGAIFLAI